MKRVLLTLVVVFIIFTALPASAQSELRLATVQVQLWPEYDRPSMLVIYTITLPDDQPLPAEVSLRIPAGVGEPSAVAVLEDSGLVTRQYASTVDGDWAVITLEADLPIIQVEYYDPALSQSDSPRSYDYLWQSDYAVDEFIIGVQQPIGASQFDIQSDEPVFGVPEVQASGMNQYTASLGSLEAGETFSFSLSYTKTSTALSIESLLQDTSTADEAPASESLPVWVWVLVGVGGVFVGVGVIYFVRASTVKKPASSYRRKKQRSSGRADRSGGKNLFCHQCGSPAEPGDKFCRECGTKLRV